MLFAQVRGMHVIYQTHFLPFFNCAGTDSDALLPYYKGNIFTYDLACSDWWKAESFILLE